MKTVMTMDVLHLIGVSMFWLVFGIFLTILGVLIGNVSFEVAGITIEWVSLSYSVLALVEEYWPDEVKRMPFDEALKKLLSMPANPKLREEALEGLKGRPGFERIDKSTPAYGPFTTFEMGVMAEALIDMSDASWWEKFKARRKVRRSLKQ